MNAKAPALYLQVQEQIKKQQESQAKASVPHFVFEERIRANTFL